MFRRRQSANLLLALSIVITVSVVLYWAIWGRISTEPSNKQGSKDSKLAFATILLPPTGSDVNSVEDPYFTSTRMLNYQLKHNSRTHSKRTISFLVVATPDILPEKRLQLEHEGAIVIVMDRVTLGSDWIVPMASRWKDVMLKLRLFELVAYDKILFLDADTYLLECMGGIFEDAAAQPAKVLTHKNEIKADEATLPESYLFATLPEMLHTTHPCPPHPWPRFNAGFILFAPSFKLFEYYTSLLALPERFVSTYPEQNLLNYAHREGGNMPWALLDLRWNTALPNMHDVKMGVKSVHAKLWTEGTELQPVPKELRDMWSRTRGEMEAYYEKTRRS